MLQYRYNLQDFKHFSQGKGAQQDILLLFLDRKVKMPAVKVTKKGELQWSIVLLRLPFQWA